VAVAYPVPWQGFLPPARKPRRRSPYTTSEQGIAATAKPPLRTEASGPAEEGYPEKAPLAAKKNRPLLPTAEERSGLVDGAANFGFQRKGVANQATYPGLE